MSDAPDISLPPVRLETDGPIGVIVIDNPPVNASSIAVRAGLLDAVHRVGGDASLVACVIIGAGKVFMAGADIREFDKPPIEPGLSAVFAAI
jgi:3-hydroxyacyl-CoA dehydrogenase